MSKILGFISKSNQVFFFLAVLIFIVMASIEIISDLVTNRYEPPKIELVDNSGSENEVKKQVYTVDFLAKLRDVHIFELSSNVIDTSKYHESEVFEMFNGAKVSHDLTGGLYLSDSAVNLMFVKENSSRRMLLKKDGLIKEFSKAKSITNDHSFRLDKNLYLIIDEDTNSNGYLDHKDSVKLFTSEYDGKNLTHVLSNVGSFKLIGDNELIISRKGDSASFFTFNVVESSLKSLNTAINVSDR